MLRKRLRWSAHLTCPISIRGGPTLRTLHDIRAFMLGLPEGVQLRGVNGPVTYFSTPITFLASRPHFSFSVW